MPWNATSSPLFAQPARWGYELIEPAPAAEHPGKPPKLQQVRLVARAQTNGQRKTAVIAAAATVGTLTLDSALGAFSLGEAKGTASSAAAILADLVAAAVAFWIARELRQSTSERQSGELLGTTQRDLWPALIALMCFFLPSLVLAVEAFFAWRRVLLGKGDLVYDPAEARRAEAEHRRAMSAWKEHRKRLQADETERIQAIDRWYPVPFSSTAPVAYVFGGAAASWTAALTTLGASLLGSGVSITIGDLSERLTTRELGERCASEGIPVAESVFAGTLQPAATGSRASLEMIGVDKHTVPSEYERRASELFRLLLSQAQRGLAHPGVLVILGADRIGYDELKSLITVAERERIGLLLFFENFRLHAVDIVGEGHATTAFFALGNHREAEEASRFIGTEEQWRLARRTLSAGTSHSQTPGWAESTTTTAGVAGPPFGLTFSGSTTTSRSYSETSGQSAEYAEDEELTPEAVVKPRELRGLPSSEMIYVEMLPDGPAVTRLNCDPSIATEPRVAGEPYRRLDSIAGSASQ